VLSIAQTPELSAGLRARVLSAAIESQRRRSYGRRAVWAAGLVVVCAALTAWQAPLGSTGGQIAERKESADQGEMAGQRIVAMPDAASMPSDDLSPPLLNVSARYGRGELLLSAAGDDWRLVEAELHSRREGIRHLRLSF
jgi:hypothetical protein